MELAEQARLERDAALSAADSRARDVSALTARLADATRQLGAGGGGAGNLKQRAEVAEQRAAEGEAALSAASDEVGV